MEYKKNIIIKNICKKINSYINNKNNITNYIFNTIEFKKQYIKKPCINKINNFISYILKNSYIEPECIILLMIYIDRILNNSDIKLQPNNWRNIIFCCLIIANKITDDYTFDNRDFVLVFPQFDINNLEKKLLKLLQYNIHIDADLYDTYFNIYMKKKKKMMKKTNIII
jgi:hypothetical protein